MEKLEKYIADHREDFDSALPSLKVWAAIDKTLEEKKSGKRVQMWKYLRVAAAAGILLMVGGIGGAYMNGNFDQNQGAIAQLAPEHADLEKYYTEQVEQKTKQLVSLKHEGYVRVEEDLKKLDDTFAELMQEYQKLPTGSGSMVIQAMLENYQAKLDILERVLEKVNHNNPNINLKDSLPKQDTQDEDDSAISI
ncbi:MAG: replicative DNA helicase [Paraglaciecola sp.]|jgi:replicative DNA helicase